MSRLDITTLKTVENIEAINESDYFPEVHTTKTDGWVRYIEYPISQKKPDRICPLAANFDKILFSNSMGELYVEQKLKRNN